MAQALLLYVGTTAGVTILSNPGRIERWLTAGRGLSDSAISALAVDPADPMQVQASTPAGPMASTDGGRSWQAATDAAPELAATSYALPLAPAAAVRIAEAGQHLERQGEDGHWQPLEIGSSGTWTALILAGYHPDGLFAGTSSGEVWHSSDRGRSWKVLKRDLPAVQALAIGRIIS